MTGETRRPDPADDALALALDAVGRFEACPPHARLFAGFVPQHARALAIPARHHLLNEHERTVRKMRDALDRYNRGHAWLLDAYETRALKAVSRANSTEQAEARVETRRDWAEDRFKSLTERLKRDGERIREAYHADLSRAFASRWEQARPRAWWKRPLAWLAHKRLAGHLHENVVRPYLHAVASSVNAGDAQALAALNARVEEVSNRIDAAIEKLHEAERKRRRPAGAGRGRRARAGGQRRVEE